MVILLSKKIEYMMKVYIFFQLVLMTSLSIGCDKNQDVQGTIDNSISGAFTELTIANNIRGTGSILLEDIYGDSNLEIMIAGLQDDQIIILEKDGPDPDDWNKNIVASTVNQVHTAVNGDLDNDGNLDIIGAAYVGSPGLFWWRNLDNQWQKNTIDQTLVGTHELIGKDLDLDGDIDIIGVSSELNEVSWWRNEGGDPISWTKQIINSNISLAKSVEVADLDQDGDMDVVTASLLDNSVIWWRNDGGDPIIWEKLLIDNSFIGAHHVQCIDIDNDGNLDILGAGYMGNEVAWWQNKGGNANEWIKQSLSKSVSNACVALAADMDNDGDLDIVATAQGANKILLWTNNGGDPITWSESIITDSFTRPWPLDLKDIDGDGDIDIVSGSSHNGSDEIKLWINNSL